MFLVPNKMGGGSESTKASPSKPWPRSDSEYLATDMLRRKIELPPLDLHEIQESPERLSPRKTTQKRRSLPPKAFAISDVTANRRDKERIKRELQIEWKKERVFIDRFLADSRSKLKPSNKKHPLYKFRKIVHSIIWMNKLFKPTVKKMDDAVNLTIIKGRIP